MRHDLTSLFSALYSRVWTGEGGGREDVGGAGQVRHTTGHWQDPATWSMIPGFDIVGCKAAASELQIHIEGQRCVSINCICLCGCVCKRRMECIARKVTTSLSNLTSPLFLFLPLSNGLFWRWPWQAMVWILIYVPVKLKSKIPSTAALWQLGWWMVQSLGQTKPLCLCPTF